MYEDILKELGEIEQELYEWNGTRAKDFYKCGRGWHRILERIERLKEKVAGQDIGVDIHTAYLPNPADPEKPFPYEPE